MGPCRAVLWCVGLSAVHALHTKEQRRANIDVVVDRSVIALDGAQAFFAADTFFAKDPVFRWLLKLSTSKLFDGKFNTTYKFNVHHDYVPFATVLEKCKGMDPQAKTTEPKSVTALVDKTATLCSGEQCTGGPQASYASIRDALSKGHLFSTQSPIIFAGCQEGGLQEGAVVSIQTWVVKGVHTESYCRVTRMQEVPDTSFELELMSLEENLVQGSYSYKVVLAGDKVDMTIKKKQAFNTWFLRALDALMGSHQKETETAVTKYMTYFKSMVTDAKPDTAYVETMFKGGDGEACSTNSGCASAECVAGRCKGGMVCPLLQEESLPVTEN